MSKKKIRCSDTQNSTVYTDISCCFYSHCVAVLGRLRGRSVASSDQNEGFRIELIWSS